MKPFFNETLCVDTLKGNGITERKHRYIVETTQSLLLSASVSSELYGEFVLTIVNLINIMLSSHI